MPRAATSSRLPVKSILLGAAVLLALVLGVVLLRPLLRGGQGSAVPRGMAALPVAEYIEDSTSCSGNRYFVDAEVHNRQRVTDAGSVISVHAGPSRALLAILVPETLREQNIDRGRRYRFILNINRRGVAEAESIQPL